VLCETWEIWYTPRSVAIYVFEDKIHAEQVQDHAQDHIHDYVQDHEGLKAYRTEEWVEF
jgi:hypothetical protein